MIRWKNASYNPRCGGGGAILEAPISYPEVALTGLGWSHKLNVLLD